MSGLAIKITKELLGFCINSSISDDMNQASVCSVCQQNQQKYKCSTCRRLICSLQCYKLHKAVPCEPYEPEVKEASAAGRKKKTIIDPTDEEDSSRLTEEQLERIAHSDELRDYLKYPQIRKYITEIDQANDPATLLDSLRSGPDTVFQEFIDLLVRTVKSNE
ncbi:uncharacterized protein BYT42DRAFT_566615 [Radiomyces spectabilis]|uniref:uncharacterized protein n=1 Tax=Radiomyces spectabilis TaxID=64574 RepID=UPI00221E69F3|nr:uncharacterized protein BYT42DRAFT_566615 [Radiomyces spectabilis]KAI8381465.1 hypothetical protein BYT42DRAFT_566615 [Radiomyces spectabilis]